MLMDWLGLFNIVDFVCGVVKLLKPEEEKELQPDEITGGKFYFDPDKQEYVQDKIRLFRETAKNRGYLKLVHLANF